MKVKCIFTEVSIENSSKELVNWARKSELEITLGKTYVVFAISKYLDFIFYYILGDESNSYPLAFPSSLFQITDYKISEYWKTDSAKIGSVEDISIENGEVVSFEEWTLKGDRFYENLLEGVEPEVSIFNDYRDKILGE